MLRLHSNLNCLHRTFAGPRGLPELSPVAKPACQLLRALKLHYIFSPSSPTCCS